MLNHQDDFGGYGVGGASRSAMLSSDLWAAVGANVACNNTDPRRAGAYHLEWLNGGTSGATAVYTPAGTLGAFGAWKWPGSIASYLGAFLTSDPAPQLACAWGVSLSGALFVVDSDSHIVYTSGPGVIASNAYVPLEFKCYGHHTAGVLDIYVNGTLMHSVTGLNSMPSTSATGQLGAFDYLYSIASSLPWVRVADAVGWDTTGGHVNAPLGNKVVVEVPLVADVVGGAWAAVGAASGVAALSDFDDATGIESSSVGDVSEFTLASLPSWARNLSALTVQSRRVSTSPGLSSVTAGISDGTNHVDGVVGRTAPYPTARTSQDHFYTHPTGGADLVPSDVGSLRVRVKRES